MQAQTIRIDSRATSSLAGLMDLARAARRAQSRAELEFLLVNNTHGLTPYRQAALWHPVQGIRALSGVVQAEAHVPFVQWLARLAQHLHELKAPARLIDPAALPQEIASEWQQWLPPHSIWLPLGGESGGVLFARDLPWLPADLALLGEWADMWQHADGALDAPRGKSLRQAWHALRRFFHPPDARRWWQHAPLRYLALVLGVALFPVRLSVLAPGELVPAHPAIVRSPLEGVIAQFYVSPNQAVKKDAPLFGFDEAVIFSRLEVARQALLTAQAEHRQATQQAMTDAKARALLAPLAGKVEEKRSEVALFEDQLGRARVLAPRDGLVLMDDPAEWIGRPVAVGERILRVAAPDDVEVEVWLPVSDAIPLKADAPVSLYLNASPLSPVSASLRYQGFDAQPRPDGSFAYRLRAKLEGGTSHRVGLKGTAKVTGGWVPLVYWVMRRPLATVRGFVGI